MKKIWLRLLGAKFLIGGLLLATGLLALVGTIQPQRASADHLCPHFQGTQLYGRDVNCGYFLNSYVDVSGVGLLTNIPSPWTSEALWEVGDVDTFIAVIRYHLQGCTPGAGPNDAQRRNAAAFIVLTMQGAGAGTPANTPCVPGSIYHVNNWENLVRQFAAQGLVDFNRFNVNNYTYGHNTRLQRSTQDVAWYYSADTQPSIIFHRPGGGTPLYAIKKNCANPVGVPGFLFNLATPPGLSCVNISTSVGNPEVNQPFTISLSFRTSGGTGPPIGYVVVVNFPAGGLNNRPIALATMGRNATATATTPTVSVGSPGAYGGSFVIVMPGANPGTLTCPFGVGQPFPPVTVVAKPYYRVYGGDVFAGAGFQSGATCATDQNSSIIGWNHTTPAFIGSGTQLAAFALGQITEFASGQLRTNAAQAKQLTFSNTGPPQPSFNNYGAGIFGGGLLAGAGTTVCAPNYFAGATGVLTGAVNIAGRTLGMGQRQTIYVDGDATITGNIDYAGGNYNGVDQIPSFRLIVHGNIYVGPGVQRLSGVYVAQPKAARNDSGRFYTCWPGHMPTTAELNGVCRTNRLTVTGAVVAELVKLTRSQGSLSQSSVAERYDNATGTPAEIFLFSPEVWLTGGFNGSGEFDSVTALPPVL